MEFYASPYLHGTVVPMKCGAEDQKWLCPVVSARCQNATAYFRPHNSANLLRYFQQVPEKENPVTMVGPVVSCFSPANQQTRQNYSLRTRTRNLGLVIAGLYKAKIEKRNCEEHCGEFLMTLKKADKLSEKQQIIFLALKI